MTRCVHGQRYPCSECAGAPAPKQWAQTERDELRDAWADLRKAVFDQVRPVLLPVVEWVSRRTPLQFAALYVVIASAFVLMMVWTVTHP